MHARTQQSSRGQTEPLAALVAVAAVCLAVSTYAGTLSGVIPAFDSDRTVGEGTAQRVWHQVAENGVYTVEESNNTAIDPSALPHGYHVAVNVTYVGSDGRLDNAVHAQFDPTGALSTVDPPANAERYTRPVPVRVTSGDIRPGKLTVVVWNA